MENSKMNNPSYKNKINNKCFHFTIRNFFIVFIAFYIIALTKAERLEPLNLILERNKIYRESIQNFTNNLNITLQEFSMKNYGDKMKNEETNINSNIKCFATKKIRTNEEIFSIPLENTFNIYERFPFKKLLLNKIKENSFIKNNPKFMNMTNYFLLAFRIMFDMKADMKKTFTMLKVYDQVEFKNGINYLKQRNYFIQKYSQVIPLADNLGQMSWSTENIEEYKLTGIMPILKDTIVRFYKEFTHDLYIDKDFYYLYNVTNHWLNEANVNYFLSIYGYVIKNSIIFNLDFSDIEETKNKKYKSYLESYKNNINEQIITQQGGGLIIIPFIDQCRYYHPRENAYSKDYSAKITNIYEKTNNNYDKDLQLKRLKIKFDEDAIKLVIRANSNLESGQEFSYTFTDFLTNDNLLLNYGIVIRNNLFQEFLFKFEMLDYGYKFLNGLRENNFDVSTIKILEDYQLSLQFSLKKDVFSKGLFDFISIYAKLFISNDDAEINKNNKSKINIKNKNMNENDSILLKSLVLYDSTINKNIYSMLDSLDNNEEDGIPNNSYYKNKSDHKIYYEKIDDNIQKMIRLENIIRNNTIAINKEKNLEIFEHDDIQNLFFYKALHDHKKSLLIKIFNFENLKILYSHKNIVNKETISLLKTNIQLLKARYT